VMLQKRQTSSMWMRHFEPESWIDICESRLVSAAAGERLALSPKPVGRKVKLDAGDRRVAQLEGENAWPTHRLVDAWHLIALQVRAQELMAALDGLETPR
jgi:hypothetical protein